MKAQYVIWSNQHGCWWGPNGRGYTQWLEEAGRYSLADARSIVSKTTLDGQLVEVHGSHIGYGQVTTSPEHMMLAPESLTDLVDQVERAIAVLDDTTPVIEGLGAAMEEASTLDFDCVCDRHGDHAGCGMECECMRQGALPADTDSRGGAAR